MCTQPMSTQTTIAKTPISAYSVNLRPINENDLPLLLTWRNREDIRLCMLNQNIITQSEHSNWYQNIKHSAQEQHYIIYYKELAIGAINIRCKNENLSSTQDAEIGLYIAEEKYQGNIIAFAPALALTDFAFHHLNIKTLSSKVIASNASALKYNRQLGYNISEPLNSIVDISLTLDSYNKNTINLKKLLNRGNRFDRKAETNL